MYDEYTDAQNLQIVFTRLAKYMPTIREFWKRYPNDIMMDHVGSFMVDEANAPGLMYRVCPNSIRSPIKHLQVFTFVPVAFLQISGISGGVNRMVERVCNEVTLDEFTIVQKHASPATYNGGHILCIVPTEYYNGTKSMGKWVYLTYDELMLLRKHEIPVSAHQKFMKFIN